MAPTPRPSPRPSPRPPFRLRPAPLLLLLLLLGVAAPPRAAAAFYEPEPVGPPLASIPLTVSGKALQLHIEVGTPPQVMLANMSLALDHTFVVDAAACAVHVEGGRWEEQGLQCFNSSASSSFIDCPACPSLSSKYCRPGYDNARISGLSFWRPKYSLCVSSFDANAFGPQQDAIFGLLSGPDGPLQLIPTGWPHLLALNFSFDPALPSALHIGGYEQEDAITWGEAQFTPNSFYGYQFPLYHLAVCSHPLFTTTSFWLAKLSLEEQCLSLPEHLWTNIGQWIPGDCGTDQEQLYCTLHPGVQLDHLPHLSFALSEWGTELRIPLSALVVRSVVPQGSTSTTVVFCISNLDVHRNDHRILLGSAVLEHMYLALDLAHHRVGLANKQNLTGATQECAGVPVCVGEQVYVEADNVCSQPDCSAYFFQVLGSDGRCHFGWFLYVFFGMLLVGVLSAESLLSELYLRMEAPVRARALQNEDPAPAI